MRDSVPPRFPVAILICCLAVLTFAAPARPAGMSVHGEVCTRAAHFLSAEDYPEYRDLLMGRPAAYQAGSAFPDWGYSAGYPDESEEAHWPPFLEAFGAYVHETYPRPWNEETKRLVSFYLGIVSHDVADIDWHGLAGVREGLIDVMSRQEFNGNWQAAHGVADTGGDIVQGYERDMNWLASSWYVPLEDAAAVYQRMGYAGVTAEVLLPRTFLLFLGAQANKLGGFLLFPDYASASPFLVEQLQDYFVGGIDGMAVRTNLWWETYIDLLENGPGASGRGVARSHSTHEHPISAADVERGVLGWASGLIDVSVEHTGRGVTYRAELREEGTPPAPAVSAVEAVSGRLVYGERPYGYAGRSLAAGDFDGDGIRDLAVGVSGSDEAGPAQAGAVHILNGREDWGSGPMNIDAADTVLLGKERFGRFGWSLAVMDLNADGRDDLAVSAPSGGIEDLAFRGEVSIYFGSGGPAGISGTPDVVIDAGEDYENLGWSLAAGDADGDGRADLLVGSPRARAGGEQRGSAAVFLAREGLSPGTELGLGDADWLGQGQADYDWFGYALGILDRGSAGRLLVVGAPGRDTGDHQAAGALYGYDLAAPDATAPVFVLLGEGEFDKVGPALAAGRFYDDGRDVLALSAPMRSPGGRTHAGVVYLLDAAALDGERPVSAVPPLGLLEGDDDFGRLGWALASGDTDGDGVPDLLVSQPWKMNRSGRMAGSAYLWRGGPGFPGGAVSPEDATGVFPGTRQQARFGDAALISDLDGDGVAEPVLAASRDSSFGRFGGTVHLRPASVKPDCFVATAALGSERAGKIRVLRDFRDHCVLRSEAGKRLVDLYYAYGPALARWVEGNPWLGGAVRVLLLPLLGLAHLLL